MNSKIETIKEYSLIILGLITAGLIFGGYGLFADWVATKTNYFTDLAISVLFLSLFWLLNRKLH